MAVPFEGRASQHESRADGTALAAQPKAAHARRRTVERAGKRAIDLFLSSLVLVLSAPLILVVVLLVRLTSRGPVLFCQERMGKDGRRFRLYKFRTMYTNADQEVHRQYAEALIRGEAAPIDGVFKLARDPRVTPVGRFLRRYSLDELPQLLNVLKGEMSLVGPRPPIPYEVENYGSVENRRLEVLPGLTGLWQVSGRNELDFKAMIQLDIRYIDTWSLALDILILIRTPLVVLAGKGAK